MSQRGVAQPDPLVPVHRRISTALLVLLLTTTSPLAVTADREDYEGFILIRVVPRTPKHQDTLLNLNRAFAGSEHIDFWRHGSQLLQPVEMLVSKEMRVPLLSHLRLNGMRPRVQVADMKSAV